MSVDLFNNLSQIITQVSKEKGMSREIVVHSIVQGVLSVVRKKYGSYRDIEVKYNEDLGELELFEFKQVVPDKDFVDELIEVKYSEAKKMDPEAQIGDQIGVRMELKDLGRIDAYSAKQIIIQSFREIEHKNIFEEFEKRKGEIATGTVRRVDPGMIVVDLEKTEAYIPRREQIPGEKHKSGDRIQGYILEVRQGTRGPRIIMSRACEQYMIKLFTAEVPEVYEGIVKIAGAAREPGQRAKMAVYSTDPAVHPVGSCVGIKGSRIQNISQELKGERVDVIEYESKPVDYVCNALAPAKISKVVMNEEKKQMRIIVPDDQLSLAIGKRGQNVRLAAKLTEWDLNLMSEREAEQKKKEALFYFALLPDLPQDQAEMLFQYGWSKPERIAEAKPEDLITIPGFQDKKAAVKLIQSAKDLIKKYKAEGKEFPQFEEKPIDKKPAVNLKEQAEEILKKELAQLEGVKSAKPSASIDISEKASAEEPSKPEDKAPAVDNKTAKPEEDKAPASEGKTPKPEDKATASNDKTQKPEDDKKDSAKSTAKPEDKSPAVDNKTAKPDDKTANDDKTAKPEDDKKDSAKSTAKPEDKSPAVDNKTAKPDDKTANDDKTAKPEDDKKDSAKSTAKPEDKSPAGDNNKTTKPEDKATANDDKTQKPEDKSAKPEDKAPASNDKTPKPEDDKKDSDKSTAKPEDKAPANDDKTAKPENKAENLKNKSPEGKKPASSMGDNKQ